MDLFIIILILAILKPFNDKNQNSQEQYFLENDYLNQCDDSYIDSDINDF